MSNENDDSTGGREKAFERAGAHDRETQERAHRGRRGGRRTQLSVATSGPGFVQRPWTVMANFMPPVKFVSDDEVESIHRAGLQILTEIGLKFTDPKARAVLKGIGCDVDEASEQVKFDPALVEEYMVKAPNEWVNEARNPAHNLPMGGNVITYSTTGGPAFVSDLDRGRRMGTMEDLKKFIKMFQVMNVVHRGGIGFSPNDVPAPVRHLETNYALISMTDKTLPGGGWGRERQIDSIDMACIAMGVKREDLNTSGRVLCMGGCNVNSPLLFDTTQTENIMTLAEHGQAAIVTPFTLAGSMAPITLAGAIAQQHAEALSGIVLIQATRPGAPVAYGAFTTNVDMQSGAPAFGTPEYAKTNIISGQMARRVGVPYRSSSTNTSNAPDSQSAYESMMSLWGDILGHCNIIAHGAGWIEGGLTCSFEKFVIDCELLQMMNAFMEPISLGEDDFAIRSVGEVGPGGNFFTNPHTLARYKSEFYSPLLSDWRNFETFEEAGAVWTAPRANGLWKKMVEAYEQPPIDVTIDDELKDFVARRSRQIEEAA